MISGVLENAVAAGVREYLSRPTNNTVHWKTEASESMQVSGHSFQAAMTRKAAVPIYHKH